jgi:hypothetical protein
MQEIFTKAAPKKQTLDGSKVDWDSGFTARFSVSTEDTTKFSLRLISADNKLEVVFKLGSETEKKPTIALLLKQLQRSTQPAKPKSILKNPTAVTPLLSQPSRVPTPVQLTPIAVRPAPSNTIGDYFYFIVGGIINLFRLIGSLFQSSDDDADIQSFQTSFTEPAAPQKINGIRGISNEGNTCFINAVFQALMNAPEMLALLITAHQAEIARLEQEVSFWDYSSPDARRLAASRAFLDAIIAYKTEGTVSLKALRGFVPHGGSYSQEDPHELLNGIFGPLAYQKTPDHRLFMQLGEQKKLKPYVAKDNAEKERLALEMLTEPRDSAPADLMMVPRLSPEYAVILDLPVQAHPIPLQTVINNNLAMHPLSEADDRIAYEDGWYTPKTKRTVVQPMKDSPAPEWVVLQLKRFRYNKLTQAASKVQTEIGLPADGKFRVNFEGNVAADYDIQALVLHSGLGIHGGHCYSSIRQNDEWIEANDSSVTKIGNLQRQAGNNVYLVFAKKRA